MFDFVIIGGGIIGLLTAKELQERGANVAVIEKTSTGQQSTWAAGGILAPMRPWHYCNAVNAISFSSQSIYQQLSEELHRQTGIDPEWLDAGMLVLNDDDMAQGVQWCKQHKTAHQVLSTEQLSAQFPYLKTIEEPALLREGVASIQPHKLLAALTRYLSDCGVTFHTGHAANIQTDSASLVASVAVNGTAIKGHEYIVCGGAWSPQLMPSNVTQPDIQPVKGQMICFPPSDIPNHCMIMDGDRYIIPRKDGRIVVGSTREHTGFDAETTQQAFTELRDFAQQLYPALSGVEPNAHWAGLRPSSPDSIPYISRVEPYLNLSINAGHYRNGIVTAPASAQLMADIVSNKPTSTDLSPYQLQR